MVTEIVTLREGKLGSPSPTVIRIRLVPIRNRAHADTEAFRWTSDGGMVGLGALEPGGSSVANGVSADGSVVVGAATLCFPYDWYAAFIWDSTNGMRELGQVLTSLGIDLTGWTLDEARGVSGDGLTIVGTGTNPSGDQEGWIAVLDPTIAVEIDIKPDSDLNPSTR